MPPIGRDTPGALTPEADDGIALYMLGHAGVKAALFAAGGPGLGGGVRDDRPR
ncbi:hypothetical protein AB0G20_25685 [Streptomyces sp. NPDC024017]|uniref:hypothetical protein n=1 Tax=Streptomyces sp. NPDC024017 TaxID=3154326 RepID=UPI00340BE396